MVKICDTNYTTTPEPQYKTIFERYPYELDHFQKYAIQGVEEGAHVLITAHTGSGKCLKFNTPIMMSDGTTKPVQDINVGDILMGDDSTPRNVLGLARGIEHMYNITLSDGSSFGCNESHILCLKYNRKPYIKNNKNSNRLEVHWFDNKEVSLRSKSFNYKNNPMSECQEKAKLFLDNVTKEQKPDFNISVKEFMKLPKNLIRNSLSYKVGLDFNEKLLLLDPYIMGIWLGVRTSMSTENTNSDAVILNYVRKNTIKEILKKYNLLNNKHIPDDYKINSRDNRLRLLAGLIDSDGHYKGNTYEITQKNKTLAYDIKYLVQSLGFNCKMKEVSKYCTYKNERRIETYFRVTFFGDNTEEIPVLCERKKSKEKRFINKPSLEYSFKITSEGIGTYYGFEIDGNHKFVLGNFIVTHNTMPAEYAIEKFCSQGKQVIYTAPIKSLSNQKFHEFTKKFPHISFGILTGDIKFNPEADCIIMTTEILRNTLFREVHKTTKPLSDVDTQSVSNLQFNIDITNLACVVFDEVHYINDADRGKVWEESIIQMPSHVQMVMLSATIDKPDRFAQWIETTKQRDVWLAPTDKRVVPLTHYSYFTLHTSLFNKFKDKPMEQLAHKINNKLVPIQDPETGFITQTIEQIHKLRNYMYKEGLYTKPYYVFNELVKYLKTSNKLPAITFVFSRRKVEEYAKMVETTLFNDETESHYPALIDKECKQILRKLPNHEEYTQLPEYSQMVALLEKGIAIHHSGIMPVLREMVELLFDKGYVKLLIATETFAVGINMPTKTVVFTSLNKYSNGGFRELLPHEYTQMAGRAGRRGLDKVGHVIHMNNIFDTPYVSTYKQILGGVPQRLLSKFHINYALILRLMKYCSSSNEQEQFISKSILYEEVQRDFERQENDYNILKRDLSTSDTQQFSSTPLETLERYHNMVEKVKCAKQKQRKKMERDMQQLKNTTKTFERDYDRYCNQIDKVKQLDTMKETMQQTMEYISVSTENIFYDLASLGFIEEYNVHAASTDETPVIVKNAFRLTEKGEYASMVQELHPLVFGDALYQKIFDNLDAKEILTTIVSFIDIQIQEEQKNVSNETENENAYNAIEKIKTLYDKYYTHQLKTYQSIDEKEYPLNYDVNNAVYNWCKASNEYECKQVISELSKKNVTIGTFVKMILKLNNIVAELMNVAQYTNNIPLMYKLSTISEMTLKYVVTNQSLYV